MAGGTWNDYYDQALVVLTAGYLCQTLAAKNTASQVSETALANAELDKCAAEIGLANASLDSVAITAITTACTNLKKYLDNNTGNDAAEMLKDIIDDAASLRTAINTAVDAMNTYLDSVDTGDFALATYGAEALIQTGIGTHVNAITTGDRVPENYIAAANHAVSRANARVQAALGYAQEASVRLSNLRTYIEASAGYTSVAAVFAREAEAQVNAQRIYIEEANGQLATAQQYAVSADGYRQNALVYAEASSRYHEMYIEYRNDAWSMMGQGTQATGDTVVVKTSQR